MGISFKHKSSSLSNGNGVDGKRYSAPEAAPSSDSSLLLRQSPRRRYRQYDTRAPDRSSHFWACASVTMLAFVCFQIYFLHQLEKHHDQNINIRMPRQVQWDHPTTDLQKRPQPNRANPISRVKGAIGKDSGKKPPRPQGPPPEKKSLLPKHVIAIFGPESSGTTFLSTALGVAVGAFAPEGKWDFMPGAQWTIPNDSHQFVEQAKYVLEKTLGRRSMSPDGAWEIQHLSLPWGWFCEENEVTQIVEALVPSECWRYEIDSHVSPKTAESIWYGAAKRKQKKLQYYANPDNFEGVEKIPRRLPQEERYVELCKNEVHITETNDDGTGEWTCGAKCGTGAYDGFALYPKRFSVNISSHIEWYLSRGVEVTAILSVRDRTISTKGKLQDHCKLDVGAEEDSVALELMAEALEKYGKRGSEGERERALVVSYEGLMGIKQAHLFDLYKRLGINSTYIPEFKDGNAKYVTPYKKKPEKRHKEVSDLQKRFLDKKDPFSSGSMENEKDKGDESKHEEHDHEKPEEEVFGNLPRPSFYQPPPPKKNLLPKRIIAVFGPESSGSTFITSVLAVAAGAFPEEGRWTQILAPDPQSSIDPKTPRMKWKFQPKITERARTDNDELEVQHLSLPSGWMCKEFNENEMHVVEAFVPAECMRYEVLPDLDPTLAEQIWYNQHRRPMKGHPPPDIDTVEDFDWEGTEETRKQLEKMSLEKCRNEVKISQQNAVTGSSWTCGAKCGQHQYDGFALYPNRMFINITSHIEWYLSRGVDITVVISMRDRSISTASKRREHCRFQRAADQEDEMALSLIKSAIDKYGVRGGDKERVITVSYEALMEFREPYLFDLYYQLGINSTYVPEFKDANAKYITDATKGELVRPGRPPRLTINSPGMKQKKVPPKDWKPRPPKKQLLPKRVFTVVGLESSGTTFLSTALGVATGGFTEGGEWFQIPSLGRKTKAIIDQSSLDFTHDTVKKMVFNDAVSRRVTSSDSVEVQHLSLPWGWLCDAKTSIDVVEALVPEECFRYERGANMDAHFAEAYFWDVHAKEVKEQKQRIQRQQKQQQQKRGVLSNLFRGRSDRRLSESIYFDEEDVVKLAKCRDEGRISETDELSCGAKCGTGYYNGFALYPQRFSINITSHIEWYLSRGVDITVIVSTRDSTISRKGKLSGHCQVVKTAEEENRIAKELLEEAIQKYGKHGSKLGKTGNERVISVSYEALMGMQDSYLIGLYKQLGINSTYIPKFADGNVKYVTDPAETNLDEKMRKEQQERQNQALSLRPPKPSHPHPPMGNHEFFLPRRLITVFSLDSSKLLSTSIAVAVGAFPRGGRWVEQDGDAVFEDAIKRSLRSLDGETEIQHIMLPTSVKECDGEEKVPILDALAPSECSLPTYKEISPGTSVAEQCKDEVFISEQNDSTSASWTCGGICGVGEYDGYALYPEQYFVNISSHIEWYTKRGVDVTAVLQLRDRSITKKSLFNDIDGCRSRIILAKEDNIGLNLMKEAYDKYGAGGTMSQAKRHRKVAERAIVVSYESLIEFEETYLFGIYQQLGIRSSYVPIFIDENAKYVRTPPPKKKVAGGQQPLASRVALERKPNERVHLKSPEESIR